MRVVAVPLRRMYFDGPALYICICIHISGAPAGPRRRRSGPCSDARTSSGTRRRRPWIPGASSATESSRRGMGRRRRRRRRRDRGLGGGEEVIEARKRRKCKSNNEGSVWWPLSLSLPLVLLSICTLWILLHRSCSFVCYSTHLVLAHTRSPYKKRVLLPLVACRRAGPQANKVRHCRFQLAQGVALHGDHLQRLQLRDGPREGAQVVAWVSKGAAGAEGVNKKVFGRRHSADGWLAN